MIDLKPGDIVALRALWWQRWLTKLTAPPTDRCHFLLLSWYIPGEEDWVVYESIVSRGMRVARLSWYSGQHARIYRVADESAGQFAVYEATKYGRARYDYLLPIRLIWVAVKYWFKNGLKRIPYDAIPDLPNRGLLCTELVVKSYENYFRLVPQGIAATPSALEQAYLDGKLMMTFEGKLQEITKAT